MVSLSLQWENGSMKFDFDSIFYLLRFHISCLCVLNWNLELTLIVVGSQFWLVGSQFWSFQSQVKS